MVILNFQNLYKEKLFASISARWVPQYEFYSGTQIGTEAGKGSRAKYMAVLIHLMDSLVTI
jgi:iron complex outermembrane receptor protein